MGFATGVANLARKGFEPVDATRRERHRGAVHGEGSGEVPAETARRPGHERDAAGQIECQSLCHSSRRVGFNDARGGWFAVMNAAPETNSRDTGDRGPAVRMIPHRPTRGDDP